MFRSAGEGAKRRASLLVETSTGVTAFPLSEGNGVVLGRAEPADLVVEDRSLSRTHARFTLRGGFVHVEDLGSTNGVRLAGEQVGTCVLDEGDGVELGGVRVLVSGLAQPRQSSALGGFTAFRHALRSEIERASLFGRPFSLLAILGDHDGEALSGAIAPLLRSVDVGTAYMPGLVLTLLPETPGTDAVELGRRLLERVRGARAGAVVACPEDATDFERLIEAAVHAVRAARPGEVVRPGNEVTPKGDSPVVVSEATRRLYALVDRIARAGLPVLVLGETGSGKELVSRAVHERSARAEGPFVAINCASIPATLVESVLFGHEKGAFTGATDRRAGVFEQAHGGSVFLDEVGELPAAVQAALLRVLETKRVTRVGATREQEVDVRVIAATHRDLPAMVAAGTFREDLLFRLDALSLRVPPLRERPEEVRPLAERFLAAARKEWGVRPRRFSDEALAVLDAYRWPGNVRQLKNVVERGAVVALGDEILLEDLPEALKAPAQPGSTSIPAPVSAPSHGEPSLTDAVNAFEARLIREALAKTGGNHTKAAVLLKIPRRTLTNKIHALGIAG